MFQAMRLSFPPFDEHNMCLSVKFCFEPIAKFKTMPPVPMYVAVLSQQVSSILGIRAP
jgi:hypothetical protein